MPEMHALPTFELDHHTISKNSAFDNSQLEDVQRIVFYGSVPPLDFNSSWRHRRNTLPIVPLIAHSTLPIPPAPISLDQDPDRRTQQQRTPSSTSIPYYSTLSTHILALPLPLPLSLLPLSSSFSCAAPAYPAHRTNYAHHYSVEVYARCILDHDDPPG
ncbi:hypothetical protein HD554DRAFT_1027784 [Boletus coccyginus]|nr:hypothetical protein HD554DRAFT_1027784 [Boletus coccyginus]